jgi:peptidoglycan/LPS O-acetylase OafA/YrhL
MSADVNAEQAALPAASRRLDYVDGLRALAALWVAVHHCIETSDPLKAIGTPIVGPVLATLFKGQFPVMVFLMLSGFCLYYPYLRKNPTEPRFTTSAAEFFKRRWRRIAPPYLFIGAFCLVLDAVPSLQVGRWRIVTPIDRWVVASHVLFVHNLFPSHAAKIDYPMWSIGLEWQLYLFFPLLVAAFIRYGAGLTIGVTLVVAAAIRATYRHYPMGLGPIFRDGPLAYLMIFAAGMLAASMTVRRTPLPFPRWVSAAIVIGGLVAVRLGSGNGLVHDLATTVAFFVVLILAADPESATARFLSTPWLVSLGFFSYSIYLVHAPLVHLSWLLLEQFGLSHEAEFAVLALVGMPIIVGISYVFHRFFERPFMRIAAPDPRPTSEPSRHFS